MRGEWQLRMNGSESAVDVQIIDEGGIDPNPASNATAWA